MRKDNERLADLILDEHLPTHGMFGATTGSGPAGGAGRD